MRSVGLGWGWGASVRFETSPEAIVAAAKKAEEVGFDAIFVNDHIIVDSSSRAAPWTNVYDPFVAMSFIAAHTTRIGVQLDLACALSQLLSRSQADLVGAVGNGCDTLDLGMAQRPAQRARNLEGPKISMP